MGNSQPAWCCLAVAALQGNLAASSPARVMRKHLAIALCPMVLFNSAWLISQRSPALPRPEQHLALPGAWHSWHELCRKELHGYQRHPECL